MVQVYAENSDTLNLGTTLFGSNPVGQYADKPIGTYISSILPNVFTIIGVILFVYLLFGGFLIVTAAGNEHNLEQGQKTLSNAIIGLVIVFAAYWIIQFIEIITGVNIL